LEQKRDEGPKTYRQGKYDEHARKQNMVMGGHPIGKVESSLLSKALPICWAL